MMTQHGTAAVGEEPSHSHSFNNVAPRRRPRVDDNTDAEETASNPTKKARVETEIVYPSHVTEREHKDFARHSHEMNALVAEYRQCIANADMSIFERRQTLSNIGRRMIESTTNFELAPLRFRHEMLRMEMQQMGQITAGVWNHRIMEGYRVWAKDREDGIQQALDCVSREKAGILLEKSLDICLQPLSIDDYYIMRAEGNNFAHEVTESIMADARAYISNTSDYDILPEFQVLYQSYFI